MLFVRSFFFLSCGSLIAIHVNSLCLSDFATSAYFFRRETFDDFGRDTCFLLVPPASFYVGESPAGETL